MATSQRLCLTVDLSALRQTITQNTQHLGLYPVTKRFLRADQAMWICASLAESPKRQGSPVSIT